VCEGTRTPWSRSRRILIKEKLDDRLRKSPIDLHIIALGDR
jgi:hypothetical protein